MPEIHTPYSITIDFEPGYGYLPSVKVDGMTFYRGEYRPTIEEALFRALRTIDGGDE